MPISNYWTYNSAIPPIPLALEYYDELAAQVAAIDTATVAGGISQFVKTFNYQSGSACVNC